MFKEIVMKVGALILLLITSCVCNANTSTGDNPLAGRCEKLSKTLAYLSTAQRNRHCIDMLYKASKDAYAAKLYLDVSLGSAAVKELINTQNWLSQAVSRNCKRVYDMLNAKQEAIDIAALINH
jgi:hypothetical protein